jgi:hypothetical protein
MRKLDILHNGTKICTLAEGKIGTESSWGGKQDMVQSEKAQKQTRV